LASTLDASPNIFPIPEKSTIIAADLQLPAMPQNREPTQTKLSQLRDNAVFIVCRMTARSSKNPILLAMGEQESCEEFRALASDASQGTREQWNEAFLIAAGNGWLDRLNIALPRAESTARDKTGLDALCLAAVGGHARCVERLIPFIDAHFRDPTGNTALCHAAKKGSLECVNLLIPVSDPLASNDRGWTPLMHAALKDLDCVKALAPVSDVKARDTGGNTALTMAMISCQLAPEFARFLLPLSDPRAATALGETALMVAAKMGSEELARVLAPLSDPLAINHKGQTALFFAAATGKLSVLEALSSFGGHLSADAEGFTPLMVAAANGRAECVQFLAPFGLDGVARPFGRNALMLAAQNGHDACLDVLAALFPAEAQDMAGFTAFGVAVEQRQWKCAKNLAKTAPLDDLRALIADFDRIALSVDSKGAFRAILEAREISEGLFLPNGADTESISQGNERTRPRSL